MGKSSPKPPPAPDYAAAAKEQGAANLDAARLTARISNPNISTPYGGQRVTFGKSVFDEAGYNKAMEAYNKQLADYDARKAAGVSTGGPAGGFPGGDYYGDFSGMEGRGEGRGGNFPIGAYGGQFGGAPVAPTREQFTTQTDQDTPYIEQYLSPEQQKILEAQQRVELGLSGVGETALGTVQDVLGKRFQPNLRDLQTTLGGYGQVQGAPDLTGMGRATGDVNAYEFGGAPELSRYGSAGGGPAGGLFGLAQGRVPLEQLQRGIDTSQLAAMPVQAGTTGQQAILSRVAPELQRRRQALETQLANQGIPRGSEAYNEAITEQQQQENDAIQQAALQGLQLDMAARAQGFGERQAAAQFANQAALGQFGIGTTGADIYNRALQQNFQQAQAAQELQNRAVAQNQNAALQAYQALLSGQGQAFGQQMDVQAARNAALAQNQAIATQQQQLANAAQLQQYNQALQGAQFGNTALQQSLQQQLALRNQPLNEIAALMSGVQVNMPQFQGYEGANVAAAPIFAGTTAAGDFAQRNYANQVGAYNAKMGLLGNIAGAAGTAIASDRRLKSNVVRVGTHPLGIGVYEYDIFGERQRGVMADEVEAVKPEAVTTHPTEGYKMVYYGML
jgi:hypothetical protein